MISVEGPLLNDAAELQNVLTRYVDSYHGYLQVADVMDSNDQSEAFREIATRRKLIVDQVSGLINGQGEKADVDGSPEAAVHRWWIRMRAKMTDEELHAALEECIRGEKELARTAQEVITHGNLIPTHTAVLADLAAEVKQAIETFTTALNR